MRVWKASVGNPPSTPFFTRPATRRNGASASPDRSLMRPCPCESGGDQGTSLKGDYYKDVRALCGKVEGPGTSRLLKSSSNCQDADRVFTSIFRLILLNGPSLSQQSHRSPLTRAAKQQRISQGRALNDLTRPLVVPRQLRANCEVCTALNQ